MTLDDLGRQFVHTLNDVLNGTVTHGLRLGYVGREDGAVGWLGHEVTRRDLVGRPFPLRLGREKPRCWLRANQTLELDPGEGHLKTIRATIAVCASNEGEDEHQLLRYDFKRDQAGGTRRLISKYSVSREPWKQSMHRRVSKGVCIASIYQSEGCFSAGRPTLLSQPSVLPTTAPFRAPARARGVDRS